MSYKKIYYLNPETCTGCMVCRLACSLKHEKSSFNPESSRIKICYVAEEGNYIPVVCRQCEDTPCIDACSSDALSVDKNTGAVLVDEEKCSGCSLCVDSCRYGAVFIHYEKNVACICNLCGGEPECVKYCLQEAIFYAMPEEIKGKPEKKYAK
jgi:Fe-S-cluster-containing hydrogenase component 2